MQPKLEGINILIVEDHPEEREVYSTLLEGYGATVLAAASVKDALRIMEEFQPDVVFTDIGFPGESGYDFIAKIRETQPKELLPVVAVTGLLDVENIREFGFDELIRKPIDPELFIEVAARLASRRKGKA